jgi:hypothetical protein
MARDGSVLNTCPARRSLDEPVDRMRSHAFGQNGAVFAYPSKQDPSTIPEIPNQS